MTSMQRRGFLALGGLAAGSLAAPKILRAQSLTNVADTLAGDTRFARFLDMITRASSVEDFRQAAPMTVFAPVDQAFLGAPQGLLQDLLGGNNAGQTASNIERERVVALIRNHVVPGSFSPAELGGAERRLRTQNGGDILISGSGTNMTVSNPAPALQLGGFGAAGAQVASTPAQVLGSPVTASNGVIYPISQIVWP